MKDKYLLQGVDGSKILIVDSGLSRPQLLRLLEHLEVPRLEDDIHDTHVERCRTLTNDLCEKPDTSFRGGARGKGGKIGYQRK